MYENDEEDGPPKITPYNAFDYLEACLEGLTTHQVEIFQIKDNLADINRERDIVGRYFNHLKSENKRLEAEIHNLKTEIFPLLESVNEQLKIIAGQRGEQL